MSSLPASDSLLVAPDIVVLRKWYSMQMQNDAQLQYISIEILVSQYDSAQ